MSDHKFLVYWLEHDKEDIIEAYIDCVHNGEVLLSRINKAIDYINSFEYYIPEDDIPKLLDILKGEDNE